MKWLILITSVIAIAGCSAALVPVSNDPRSKVQQATDLMSVNRPIPAERLLREAMDISKERNDKQALGEAYFQYGLMLTSPVYLQYEKHWREAGKFDSTPKTAIEYMQKSLVFYGEAMNPEGQRAASFQLGRLQEMNGEIAKACSSYSMSADYHKQAQQKSPNRNYYLAPGYSSWEDMMSGFRKKIGCGS